jgi:recombination protein RecT
MTAADVEKVRQKANSKDSPAWRYHWNEMARKTVFRRAAKWLPLSAEKSGALIQALEQDDLDFDFSEVSEAAAVEAEPGARTAALANRLSGGAAPQAKEPAAEAAPAEDSEAEGENLSPSNVARLRGLCDKHGIPVAEIEQVFGEGLGGMPATMAAQVEAEILTRAKAKKGGRE